jgi:hypothetical protein
MRLAHLWLTCEHSNVLHNTLISLRPMFALVFLALLVYLRVLYVRHQNRKKGLPDVPFRVFVKRKKN